MPTSHNDYQSLIRRSHPRTTSLLAFTHRPNRSSTSDPGNSASRQDPRRRNFNCVVIRCHKYIRLHATSLQEQWSSISQSTVLHYNNGLDKRGGQNGGSHLIMYIHGRKSCGGQNPRQTQTEPCNGNKKMAGAAAFGDRSFGVL